LLSKIYAVSSIEIIIVCSSDRVSFYSGRLWRLQIGIKAIPSPEGSQRLTRTQFQQAMPPHQYSVIESTRSRKGKLAGANYCSTGATFQEKGSPTSIYLN
jgi:hypothetical protein